MIGAKSLRPPFPVRRSAPPASRRLCFTAILLAVSLALALFPMSALAQSPNERVHVVSWGETLSSISLLYDVSVDDLLRVNGLPNAQLIQAGQVLVIPAGQVPIAPPAPAGPTESGRTHVVGYGDSLFGIALLYGVDAYELAAVNGIANPDIIQPGQTLIIPGG